MTTLEHDPPTSDPEPDRTPRNRRPWLITGGILTAVALALALTAAGTWVWTAVSPEENDTRAETYPAPVAGVDLDVEIGNVYLHGSDAQDLQVEREMTWKGPEPDVEEHYRSDGTFESRANCADGPVFWVAWEECRIDYTVEAPAGTEAEVHTSVADIRVDGFDGRLDAASDVGTIHAEHLSADRTEARTNVGDIYLAFDEVRGDIDVTTDVGEVVILVPDDGTTYSVDFDTSVGSPTVDIATDASGQADHQITVRSSVGDFEVRYL